MKAKTLILITLTCAISNLKAQSKIIYDSALLQKVMSVKEFSDNFALCTTGTSAILIVDSMNYVKDCNLPKICVREVYLVRRTDPTESVEKYFVFYEVEKLKQNLYKLSFFRPISGKAIFFTLKKTKNKVKVVKIDRVVV